MAMHICRACLSLGGEFHRLQDHPVVVNSFLEIANIVIDLTNEKLPYSVCTECLQKFIGFYNFKKKILLTNEILIKKVNNNLKGGIEDGDDFNVGKKDHLRLDVIDHIQSKNRANDKIKEEILEIVMKDELEDLPVVEVFESHMKSYSDEDDCPLKEEKSDTSRKKVKKSKKKKKSHQKTKKLNGTRRTIVEVDPAKLTVIELLKEEQIRVQQAEAMKPSYLSMPYKCEKCFKGFNFERKLQSHHENHHKTNSEFLCEICTRTMSTAASLVVHLKKHRLLYQCNICGTRFVEKPRAIAHYRSTHEGIQIEMPCKHCDRVFRNRSTLNGHMRTHHPQTERPQCDTCRKTFATRDSLQDHMLIHTGEKNYACPICDKKFRLRQTVAIHLLSHSSSRSFYCAACDVSFKCRSALTYHLRTADRHVSKQQRSENTCDKCGRSFSTPYRLRSHVMTSHLGVKRERRRRAGDKETRYVCDACGRGFTARRTLLNHQLTHTGARPHACPQCDATFTQRATQRTHTSRVHRVSHV